MTDCVRPFVGDVDDLDVDSDYVVNAPEQVGPDSVNEE